jgi:uridine kinase
MLGDIINIRSEYYTTSNDIVDYLKELQVWSKSRLAIAIAGESGSGKSVTAICLQHTLAENGRKALILHLDDYFKLPPRTNHDKRVESIDWVGPQEVRLDLLQRNVDEFKAGLKELVRPLVNYKLNQILAETIPLVAYDCIIVEGTYSFLLENMDFHIFMDRTYLETKQQRDERGRDVQDDFVEKVLEIEHNIIRAHRPKAQMIVNKSYQAVTNIKQS